MQGVVVARFPLFPALLTWIEPKILTTLKGSVFVGVLVSLSCSFIVSHTIKEHHLSGPQ